MKDPAAKHAPRNQILTTHQGLVPGQHLAGHGSVHESDGVIRLHEMRQMVTDAGYRGVAEIEIFSDHWKTVDNITTLQTCAERVSKI